MTLRNETELKNTRKKLRMLEQQVESHERDSEKQSYARELSVRSLKRLINQLKEAIARFEAGQRAAKS